MRAYRLAAQTDVAKSEVGFATFMILPFFEEFCDFIGPPTLEECVSAIRANVREWETRGEEALGEHAKALREPPEESAVASPSPSGLLSKSPVAQSRRVKSAEGSGEGNRRRSDLIRQASARLANLMGGTASTAAPTASALSSAAHRGSYAGVDRSIGASAMASVGSCGQAPRHRRHMSEVDASFDTSSKVAGTHRAPSLPTSALRAATTAATAAWLGQAQRDEEQSYGHTLHPPSNRRRS